MNPLACWAAPDESLARHLTLEERLHGKSVRARAGLALAIAQAEADGDADKAAGLSSLQRDVRTGRIKF